MKNRLIRLDDQYEFFLVEDRSMMADNPVSCYYLKLDDLSINLTIALK
jgi:hypothetical protein